MPNTPTTNLRSILAPSAAALAVLTAGQVIGAVTLVNLGTLPGHDNAVPAALSAGGAVVAGTSWLSTSVTRTAFRWTAAGGMQSLGALSGHPNSQAVDMSDDGSVIVGYAYTSDGYRTAFRWTEADGMVSLGQVPNAVEPTPTAVSGDGAVVVGRCQTRAGDAAGFIWTAASGMVELAPAGAQLVPVDINTDGSIIIGISIISGENTSVRWTAETGPVRMTGSYHRPTAMTPDGSFVTGSSLALWSQPTGWQPLPNIYGNPTGTLAEGLAITADGKRIVGKGSGPGYNGSKALLWSAETGTVDLNAYLPTKGVTVTGWELRRAHDISANGQVIAIEGLKSGMFQPVLITGLPSTCRADFSGEGVVNIDDIFIYINAWFAGNPDADVDSTPGTQVDDIFVFLNLWFAGC